MIISVPNSAMPGPTPPDWAKRHEQLREEEWELSRRLFQLLEAQFDRIEARPFDKIPVSHLVKLMEMASRLGRQAAGLPTDLDQRASGKTSRFGTPPPACQTPTFIPPQYHAAPAAPAQPPAPAVAKPPESPIPAPKPIIPKIPTSSDPFFYHSPEGIFVPSVPFESCEPIRYFLARGREADLAAIRELAASLPGP